MTRAPIACRRAVASLLRLAHAALRDARVLVESGSMAGAAALLDMAAARMMAAVAASEFGWPDSTASRTAGSLDNANPVKPGLMALDAGVGDGAELLPDGRLPAMLDEAAVRGRLSHADDVLTEIAGYFGVEFNRDEPARNAEPIRPPKPEPEPEPKAVPEPERTPEPDADQHPKPRARPLPSHPVNAPIPFVPRPREAKPQATPSEPSPMIQPSQLAPGGSSVAFWALMDRWKTPDLDALKLIGHQAGLTKKGTRPRFKLNPAEADMLKHLRDVDGALTSLALDPETWLRQPIEMPPFDGAMPLAFAVERGLPGVRDLSRYVFQQGLRLSLNQRT